MDEPGGLTDLGGEGHREWVRRIDACVDEAARQWLSGSPNEFVLHPPAEATPHRTSVDWTGFPLRPAECIGRQQALALLDRMSTPGEGRVRRLQEEYIEWRVVRDGSAIERVELTTELGDYWRVLAAYQPQRTLDLVSRFAGATADPAEVYPGCDPSSASPSDREEAFAAAMLSGDELSPYNDGRAAITCMAQHTNTLVALVALVLVATNPSVVRDASSGRLRCLTCEESIPLLGGGEVAQAGRASDPVLVERLARLAYEGRLVAFDDPLGVYIQSVEHTRLRTPDGDAVSLDWFTFERGLGPADTHDGRPRWQRLTVAPPAGSGLRVSDLVDVATEQPIRHGGQVADLVQLAVVLRVSDADVKPPGELEPTDVAAVAADTASRCSDVHEELADYLAEVGR